MIQPPVTHPDVHIPAAIVTRFWSKVDRSAGPDACWPWRGGRKRAGYGNFFIRRDPPGQHGRTLFMNAHKFACVLAHGPIADGLMVRHHCDNPPCCNPAHLIAGTPKENVQDAVVRGRLDFKANWQKAAQATMAATRKRRRLSEEDIAAIFIARCQGTSLSELAHVYGLNFSSLDNILHGRAYRDVPLVQQIAALYKQGIRLPRTNGKGQLAKPLDPALLEIVEAAQQRAAGAAPRWSDDPWDDGPSQEEQAASAAAWIPCEGGWEQYTLHPFDPSHTVRLFQPRI